MIETRIQRILWKCKEVVSKVQGRVCVWNGYEEGIAVIGSVEATDGSKDLPSEVKDTNMPENSMGCSKHSHSLLWGLTGHREDCQNTRLSIRSKVFDIVIECSHCVKISLHKHKLVGMSTDHFWDTQEMCKKFYLLNAKQYMWKNTWCFSMPFHSIGFTNIPQGDSKILEKMKLTYLFFWYKCLLKSMNTEYHGILALQREFPANIPRVARKDGLITGWLLPVWETQTEFQTPGFGPY